MKEPGEYKPSDIKNRPYKDNSCFLFGIYHLQTACRLIGSLIFTLTDMKWTPFFPRFRQFPTANFTPGLLSFCSCNSDKLAVMWLITPFRGRQCLPGRASETALPLSATALDKKLFTACHLRAQTYSKPVQQALGFKVWSPISHQEIWTGSLPLHLPVNNPSVVHIQYLRRWY